MKRILLCLMAFSAIISSCTRDHGDMYDPEFVREYYESQWKKQFGEIDPNQTWNVAQGVQANLSIKEDALADYTFNIYTSNPLYDKDAKLMAKTKVTTDAEGYAETSINFDAPNGLKYFYVMRVEENGRRAVKAIQTAGGVLNATFGDVNPQGARGVEEGALPTMECPYTVEQVNQLIAEGKNFSNYSGKISNFANEGGTFVVSGVENSGERIDNWYCNQQTKLVIADGGVLNLTTENTSIANLDIIVAEGGTLNLLCRKHNFHQNARLIVMPGGLVEDKTGVDETDASDTNYYIVVESRNQVQADWDTQFWVVLDPNQPFEEGQEWTVSMKVKADKATPKSYDGNGNRNGGGIETQTHRGPGDYLIWHGIGTVDFTTDWQTYTASGTIQADQVGGYSYAFNMNCFDEANKYYFDDISVKIDGQEMVVNGDCNDPTNTTSFKTKIDRGNVEPSSIVSNNANSNNNTQDFSMHLIGAKIYNAGTMKNIVQVYTDNAAQIYIAETGVYTGTEIYLAQSTDVLTNWGKTEVTRLIGANKQGTLNNGCLFRSQEAVEVLYLNLNGNTALECCTIRTNFVTLRENSILRADYYSSGDGTALFKYVGNQESSSLLSAKTMHSAAGSVQVEGKIYVEINNYLERAEENFTNANPMYGISKVGEANFAIFPSIDTSLEKSECTGQGNVPNDYVPETPANAIKWIIACEDLGSIGDYDFNDIVFSVTYVAGDETAVVEALAAGGTIPANVYVNNELIGEIHGLFGFDDTSKMINTLEEDLEDGSIFQGMVKTIAVPTNFSISTSDMGKIRIEIINGDGNVKTAIAPTQGSAPQMICVPAPWKWPVEYTSIGAAYPKFGLWGAGYNTGDNWYSTDIATGSVFNLE